MAIYPIFAQEWLLFGLGLTMVLITLSILAHLAVRSFRKVARRLLSFFLWWQLPRRLDKTFSEMQCFADNEACVNWNDIVKENPKLSQHPLGYLATGHHDMLKGEYLTYFILCATRGIWMQKYAVTQGRRSWKGLDRAARLENLSRAYFMYYAQQKSLRRSLRRAGIPDMYLKVSFQRTRVDIAV